jgi:VWFA-related protein
MRLVTWKSAALIGALAALVQAPGGGVYAQGARTAATPAPNASSQTPTFRVGTDLLTVDVSVVDSSGHPVEGLTPADFTVKIDGKVRKISAAELAKSGSDSASEVSGGGSDARLVSTARPRHVLIVVDQLYIPTGSIKPLMESASRFLDRLAPRDFAGFIAFPQGPHVDFTTDKSKVRDAMTGMIGMPSLDRIGAHAMGVAEARIITDKERYQVNKTSSPLSAFGPPTEETPVLLEAYERDCPTVATDSEIEACKQQLLSAAAEIAQRSRTDAKVSTRTLESIVKQLGAVEGSKAMVLISAALAIENQRDVDELERLAATTRTSFNVLVVDPVEENKNIGLNPRDPRKRPEPVTAADDRRVRLEGLEEIAAGGRGALYRIAGNGEGVFNRLETELSASYVLALESIADDVGKEGRKVEVSVNRPGARIRTAQAYTAIARAPAAAPTRPEDALVRDALAATSERSDIPVRVATFSRWDADTDKVRVNLAATVGQPGANADDFVIAYVVVDAQNKTVASATQKPAKADNAKAPPFVTSVTLDPGVYSVRISVAEGKNKRSTIIREVTASRTMADELATSDLVIGDAPSQDQRLTPSADPRVSSGKLAAYVELYSTNAEDLDWTFVHVEVAKDETADALVSEDASVGNGPRPTWRVASGVVNVAALPPGPYIARARIVRDDRTLRVLTRPFVIEAPSPFRR